MDYQERINKLKQCQSICNMVAGQMHHQISNNEILKNIGCSIQSFDGDWYCFHVNIPQNSFGVDAVSCSIPPDANMGTSHTYGLNATYETALVSTSGSLMYVDTLGYDDVCRFYSVTEIIDEIQRIVKKTQALPCGAPFNKVKSLVVLLEPRSNFV